MSGVFPLVRARCSGWFQRVEGSLLRVKNAVFISTLLILGGCQSSPSTSGSVRLCTEQGCSLKPKHEVSAELVRVDPALAARAALLQAQAETSPRAAFDLGLRYFRGDGVRQDSYQALQWMRRAAQEGDLQAQKAMGGFYLFGLEEMGSDPVEAQKWLQMAAARGDEESRQLLATASSAAAAQRQSSEEYFTWKTRWSETYQHYWHSGYPYYGYWNDDAWYGY